MLRDPKMLVKMAKNHAKIKKGAAQQSLFKYKQSDNNL